MTRVSGDRVAEVVAVVVSPVVVVGWWPVGAGAGRLRAPRGGGDCPPPRASIRRRRQAIKRRTKVCLRWASSSDGSRSSFMKCSMRIPSSAARISDASQGGFDVGPETSGLAARLDDVGQQAAEDPVEVVDPRGDVVGLALAADHEGQQEAHRVDVVAHELVEEVDQPLDLGRLVETFEIVDIDEIRLQRAAERGAEELLLAVEVPEDERLADLGLARDLRQRRVFVAVLGEEARRR